MSNDVFDWKFNCTNAFDFYLEIIYTSSNKIFESVLKTTLTKLKNKDKFYDVNKISEFEIDPRFYNLLNTLTKRDTKTIENEVLKDNIVVLGLKVKNAFFKKVDGKLKIKIVFVGTYIKK